MTTSYDNMLTAEEKEQMDELREKAMRSDSEVYMKQYTTQMALLYERARLRREKSHTS
ncbi:hypothetical protein [Alteribacillus iranensis]|uniref:Uncharacterized protein n=1 Tax=Alteribacillus iranensis TaxID=930128 RepID=A0A1I2CRH2_9BACI|nr:hypothetical protein [Alteribacillus iranensis]SFE70848.1 hypothetical protein SAMN05192532_103155 [Alteribacillus iranensis]